MTRGDRRHGLVFVLLVLALMTSACGARFDRAEGRAAAARTGLSGSGLSGGLGATEDTTVEGDPIAGAGTSDTVPGTDATVSGGAAGATATTAAPKAVDPGPTTGVTATTIKIGYLLPLTGAAPVPSNFDKGANVYWNYINGKGGINGRKVQVIIRDTQSAASVGKQEAQKLIEDDKVFAVVVLDRLENQKAIGAYLDSRSVPNIEIQTPANLDEGQKWTFGITIDHGVQGALIADYFVQGVGHAEGGGRLREHLRARARQGRVREAVQGTRRAGRLHQGDRRSGQRLLKASRSTSSSSGATATWLYMAPTPAAKLANQAQVGGLPPDVVRQLHLVGLRPRVRGRADGAARTPAPSARGCRSPTRAPRPTRTNTGARPTRSRRPRHRRMGRWPDRWRGDQAHAGPTLGQNSFRNTFQGLDFKPDIWAPVHFDANDARGRERRRRAQGRRRPLGPRPRLHLRLLGPAMAELVTGPVVRCGVRADGGRRRADLSLHPRPHHRAGRARRVRVLLRVALGRAGACRCCGWHPPRFATLLIALVVRCGSRAGRRALGDASPGAAPAARRADRHPGHRAVPRAARTPGVRHRHAVRALDRR